MGFFSRLWDKIFFRDWKKIFAAWHWIYRYVKRYWLQILIYTGLSVSGTLFSLLSSIVSKHLIDMVTGVNTGSVGWVAAAYIGLGISKLLINQANGKISLLMQSKVQNEIRADVFDQIMDTDWESLSAFSTGELLVRLNGDTQAVSNSVLGFLPNAISTLFSLIGAFIIVWQNDPVMALIAMAGAPVTFFISQYRMTKSRDYQKKSQELFSEKITFDQETFQNIISIKAFNSVRYFSEKVRSLQKNILDFSVQQYRYQSLSTVIMTLTGMAVSYACYGYAIYRLWCGDITFGTLTLFISMTSSLTSSFNSVVHLIPASIHVAVNAERIMEIIGLPRENYSHVDEARKIRENAKKSGIYVRAENLSFQYKDGRDVYENSSFEVFPGEIVALIGPSGKGKTTTLRLLLGLLRPQEGTMSVGNPGGLSLPISPSTRCLFSYVPQDNTMFHGTIAENLRMVKADATEEELVEALKTACAWPFIKDLENGLNTKIGENGLGFSEGQNQRMAIARALLADAPILLLDEATSALDMKTEQEVLHNIIKRDPHHAIIVAAHRPSVFSMCTRIYEVSEGKISLDKGNVNSMDL